MKRALTGLLLLALGFAVSACDPTRDLKDPPVDLGNFKLGHNIVVVRDPGVIPGSRKATEEEWQAALSKAVADRFGRYEGTRLYHLGISVDAYNLAPVDIPGVPAPKSALAVTANIWDDAKGAKLNEDGKAITVLGVFSGAGIQPTKEVQLANLSALAAKAVEDWLVENPQWFVFGTPGEAAAPAEAPDAGSQGRTGA